MLGASLALLTAAAALLGFGMVLQRVVDDGLSSGSGTALNQALLLFLMVVTVMAASVAARVLLGLLDWRTRGGRYSQSRVCAGTQIGAGVL